ncbi:MAG: TIGR04282 family arsenosugar biosynthesis glycosyltransferase [Gemmatales bacterium]|nr:TIGR04282 family arsenosugar biosynthesis glycosyltransferase [Gemmatales bacterium]MCS7160480.1 TIGR04282 family arsenosugar biosynthesis glycosyltransferase [Gemmatales bacterium]MDW8175680.1 TIGR04282 family arsenosugar biosynthesis glycosyltransferase [Gemmatales bacterium]
MSRSLVILAKWPDGEQSKTRLAQTLGRPQAMELARAFLRDTLWRYASLSVRKVLAYAPADAEPSFATLAGKDYILRPQTSGDLGARLQNLLLEEWQNGVTEVVFLGTDSPTLPLDWLDEAFALLSRVDVVLGPAYDGGYYLLGCRRSLRWLVLLDKLSLVPLTPGAPPIEPTPSSPVNSLRLPLFAEIDWGTPRVLQQTLRQIESANLTLALLPVWYDVDTADDWAFLKTHATAWLYAGGEPLIPNTEILFTETGHE